MTSVLAATVVIFDVEMLPPAGTDTAAMRPTTWAGSPMESGSIASPGRITVVTMSALIGTCATMSRAAMTTRRGATTALWCRPTDVR